uniref:BTB domain-containing protein n=1 Tax=Ditylenchus dipsaci TaxID=166011 RepID=A0A915DEW5_9BILA
MKSAEANQLGDQLKQLKLGLIKTREYRWFNSRDESWFDAIKETVIISKGSRQGYLRAASIHITLVSVVTREISGLQDPLAASMLDSDALIYDANFTISLLGSISHILSRSILLLIENIRLQVGLLSFCGQSSSTKRKLSLTKDEYAEPDCTLVVEGQKIPVCKALMMIHSSYFKAMFSREFREKNQDEIPLEGVLAVEFVHLMKVVYPSDDPVKDVNGQNVECLLRLADFFQMKIVTQRCAKYLKNYSNMKVKLEEKLLLAGTYSLSDLLDGCIAQYRTMDDLKRFVTCGQFLCSAATSRSES